MTPSRRTDDLGDEASAESESESELETTADLRLEGRRLQLIPHDVDPRYVFRFEFGPAILAQVREKISDLPLTPLDDITLERAPFPGFYQLFRNGGSVYVGRTIRPIAQRLTEHARKLRGRVRLTEMTVRYLFVEDLSLVGLSEDAMITYFHPLGLDAWGKMGFGSKAPGYGRARQQSEWHEANPPDLSFPVIAGNARALTLRQLISSVAQGAPVVLSVPVEHRTRFDTDHSARLREAVRERPFAEWIADIEARLAPGWRLSRQAMGWYLVHADDNQTPA